MKFVGAASRRGRRLSLVLLAVAVWLVATSGQASAAVAATTTTVTCPSPTPVGAAAACSVAVVAANGVLPTGSVALSRNSSGTLSTASCPLVDSGTPGKATCAFTYTPNAFGTGQHTVYANYPGDAGHAKSYGFVRFTVSLTTGRTTTTTVSCSPNPVLLLSTTTCTATVTDVAADPANASAPTGTVGFGRNSLDASFDTPTCTLSATGATTAACSDGYTPSGVDTGAHKIYANYQGDLAHAVSHGSTVVTVQDIPPVAGAVAFSGAVGNTVFGVGTSPATPSSTAAGNVLSASSDQDGDAIHAVAGTLTTTGGGSVAMNADGTFTYTPAAGFVGDDTFTFTVSDGALTSDGTATIHVVNRVWYVKNNDTGANDGRSNSPFHTLAQAQTASSSGDTIYVFQGDGTGTGQNAGIALQSGQSLIGQSHSLVIGGVTLFTGNPVNRPLITASSGAVVGLADATTVVGLAANPNGSANGISGDASVTSGATVDDVTINDTATTADVGPVRGQGISLEGSTGAVKITNTTVGVTSVGATGSVLDALKVAGSAGTMTLTLTGDAFAVTSQDSIANDAVNITGSGTATINPTVSTTTITAARGDVFQLIAGDSSSATLSFKNNTVSDNNGNIVGAGGVFTITAGGGASPNATLNFDIQNNSFRDALGNAVQIGNNSGNNAVSGVFSNNTVGVNGVANSGAATASSDLKVADVGGATPSTGSIRLTAEHNNFYEYTGAAGAEFQMTGSASLDVKFDNNVIATPGPAASGTVEGLELNSGTTTGDTNAVCFDAFANNVAGSGTGSSSRDIRLRQRQSTTVRLPGFPSFGGQTAAQFTIAQNSPPTPTAITAGTFGGGGACNTP